MEDTSTRGVSRRMLVAAGLGVGVSGAWAGGLLDTPAAQAATTSPPSGGMNVVDLGADPTGVADATSIIQNATNVYNHLYFPPGIYKIGRLTISNTVTLQGSGNQSTTLKTTTSTLDVLTFTANGWHVKDLGFDAAATRTSGAYIRSGSRLASVENVSFTKYYRGIQLDGAVAINLSNIDALAGTPKSVASGGSVICATTDGQTTTNNPGGNQSRQITISQLYADTAGGQPSYGIHLQHVDGVSISNSLIIHHGIDLYVAPGAYQSATILQITNCTFDTAGQGMQVVPTASTAVVQRVVVANTWFGSHSSIGASIDGSIGGVDGVAFTNCFFVANGTSATPVTPGIDGLAVIGANAKNVYVVTSVAAANSGSGLHATSGATNVFWTGGALGTSHGFAGNSRYGLEAESGTTASVQDTILTGNTLGSASNAGLSPATGSSVGSWIAYVPTVTVHTSGTVSSAAAFMRYSRVGKTVTFNCIITATTASAPIIKFTLPLPNSNLPAVGFGRNIVGTGNGLTLLIDASSSYGLILNYDGQGVPSGAQYKYSVSGTYESA